MQQAAVSHRNNFIKAAPGKRSRAGTHSRSDSRLR
jgi:hypothetical protein